MNDKNSEEKKKLKKDIKWYTYVDGILDKKLKGFMEQFRIKNQAKIIRDSVNHYIDYVRQIYKKEVKQKEYDEKHVNELIKSAIEGYELTIHFYGELKQKLSPLKTSILILEDFIDEPSKLNESIENAKEAFIELEKSIKRCFEEPKPIRYTKKFDILHIEDNELDRKTIKTYFKGKGADIKSVETSEEGLEILNFSTPNVILLDIDLRTSRINGDKFCKMLKSNKQYWEIPIVLITAVISEKEKGEILAKTGADDIIIKPINKLTDLDLLFKYFK